MQNITTVAGAPFSYNLIIIYYGLSEWNIEKITNVRYTVLLICWAALWKYQISYFLPWPFYPPCFDAVGHGHIRSFFELFSDTHRVNSGNPYGKLKRVFNVLKGNYHICQYLIRHILKKTRFVKGENFERAYNVVLKKCLWIHAFWSSTDLLA